ncbi:MAG: DNA polymerase III subunit alpha [Betaproteobacteria bacterium]|nr:DNA polymerase III subunit alpha [Betaproteobacteria bacterium]
MPDPSFVHLRLHSEYSIVDGIVRIEDAVAKAVADRMPALALTDLGNLFGMVKFYQAARSKGVKPVIGCDLWISNESDRDKPFRALFLAQSHEGYLLLCRLVTRAYLSNQHRGRAEIRRSWFDEWGSEGLIALSGAHLGDVGVALLQERAAESEKLARQWAARFPGRFYLELQRSGHPEAEAQVQRAVVLAAKLKLPVVATHPVQFLSPGDFKAHEARVCIAEGYVLADRRRPRNFTEAQYFRTQAEMGELFADLPSALANSVEIAKRCNLKVELGKSRLPLFPTPDGMSLEEYLAQQATAGLDARLEQLFPDAAKRAEAEPRYRARLEFETKTIVQMGFAGYFLIVADFINWAKHNGVPVGPGRGSGAGSLVAYSLGITDLDPLRYDLLFERFLNPERVSMPDFDIDFCQDGRERVIDYVKRRYGAESVSQIATFGTMAAKAVVRDVGRVLDLGYNFCDQLSKLIPLEGVKPVSLKKALEMEPQLKERYRSEEEVRELFGLAEKLEDLTRNVGMHAGGVLIAPGKLTDFCPLYCADGTDSVISQFDKDDVEQVGLVKFDFLGLTTLTILDWAVRYLRAMKLRPGDEDFTLEAIPLDDAGTYALLAGGNTTSVFQLESRGMKDLIKRARPDRFEDVIALVALYRPGPMDLIPDFTDRKHGRQRVEYLDPRLKPILGPTYGVMVYQEQVMQIAQEIGGYTLGGADLLRRAMGKKKPEEMAQHRDVFIVGAQKNGVSKSKATQLFDLMEKFAGYGFNKSHAAAYALVAYHTAYLKAHYPAAFMAANLSAVMDDTDKVHNFHEDAIANGLTVLPPDINRSDYRFTPVDDRRIRYGLGAIKGTGESAISTILKARAEGGAFKSLFDLCNRVDKRVVNRRVVESLIRGGAFDELSDHRASLLASVGLALDAAERLSLAVHQTSLFGEAAAEAPTPVEVPRWSPKEQLQNEKQALGFYLSGHPFEAYRREAQRFAKSNLKNLSPTESGEGNGRSSVLAGIVAGVRTQMTRNGKMAAVVLDDGTAKVEVSVYNELFEQCRAKLKEDEMLVVEAKVRLISRGGYGEEEASSSFLRVIVERVYTLAEARSKFARAIRLTCNGQSNAQKLKALLEPYRSEGTCPVWVVYRNDAAACEMDLGENWRVTLQDGLLQSLAATLREENVQIIYP